MPVTTRIMTAPSGSSLNVRSTLKSPDVIHVKTRLTNTRDSGSRDTSCHTAADDTRNDAIIAPHAIAPETDLLKRRPKLALSRKPTNGRRGINCNMSLAQRLNAETAEHAEQIFLRELCELCVKTLWHHHFSPVNESGFN